MALPTNLDSTISSSNPSDLGKPITHEGKISKHFKSSFSIRVKRFAFEVFQICTLYVGGWILSGLAALFTAPFKLISQIFPNYLRYRIEFKRIEALEPLTKVKLHKESYAARVKALDVDQEEAGALFEAVAELQKTASELTKGGRVASVKEGSVEKQIYEPLNRLVNTGIYEDLSKKDPENPILQFIHSLACQLVSVQGDVVLDNRAREELGPVEITGNYKQLADAADAHFSKIGYKRDSTIENIYWGIHHPKSMRQSGRAKSNGYNANLNNPTVIGHTFERRGRKIDLIYGPAVTPGDHLYEKAVVKGFQQKKVKELRFDYLDGKNKMEVDMIEQAEKIANNSEGQVEHVHVGFDEKSRFLKPPRHIVGPGMAVYSESDDLQTLLTEYQVKGTHTFKEKMLPDQYAGAFKAVGNLFRGIDVEGDDRTKRMILHTVDAFLTLAMIETTDADRIHSNCRQGVDRGAVKNAILILLDHVASGKNLDEASFYHILAPMISRAQNVEERGIQLDRYEIFHDFAIAVSRDTARFREAIQQYLQFVRESSPSKIVNE